MKKIKTWLYGRFLPTWCKDDLMETNAHLTTVIAEQRGEIDRLRGYIDGLETAMRRERRIVIRNEVKRD